MEVLKNFTPHEINLVRQDGSTMVLPSLGVARCDVKEVSCGGHLAGMTFVRELLGQVTGLPDPEEGTAYIVSRPVLDAVAATRRAVVGVTRFVRADAGRIKGAAALFRPDSAPTLACRPEPADDYDE